MYIGIKEKRSTVVQYEQKHGFKKLITEKASVFSPISYAVRVTARRSISGTLAKRQTGLKYHTQAAAS